MGISLELDRDLPELVAGDKDRFAQIVSSLLSNALDAAEAGCIRLEAVRLPAGVQDHVVIQVRDTGPGIPDEHLRHVFDRFSPTSSARQTSALALAVTKALAEAMGGKVGAVSREGEGSVFWFSIPLAEHSYCAGELPDDQEPLHILVADSQPLNQNICAAYLRRLGHTVSFAATGEEAVAMIARDHFDGVIMDVRIRGLDGLQATRRIRELPLAKAGIPIIGTINYPVPTDHPFHLAGFDEILVKPFGIDDFTRAFRRVVATNRDLAKAS
ncbi:MAG: ATP-binding protein [Pseudomonadota bacterium]